MKRKWNNKLWKRNAKNKHNDSDTSHELVCLYFDTSVWWI